jgi:hypothetical protein
MLFVHFDGLPLHLGYQRVVADLRFSRWHPVRVVAIKVPQLTDFLFLRLDLRILVFLFCLRLLCLAGFGF